MDKTVRGRARTERGNTRGGATKKRKISRTLLSINLHFSVQGDNMQYVLKLHGSCKVDTFSCFESFVTFSLKVANKY